MESLKIEIRNATHRDFMDIVNLVRDEFGCDKLSSEIYDRIERIYQDNNYVILVATLDGRVVGFASAMRCLSFEISGEYVMVIALAVKREYQNTGVGTRLADAVESFAYEIGAINVMLTGVVGQPHAHSFYSNRGYSRRGYSYVKQINKSVSPRNDGFTPIPPRNAYKDRSGD